jgi:hypothetical protein
MNLHYKLYDCAEKLHDRPERLHDRPEKLHDRPEGRLRPFPAKPVFGPAFTPGGSATKRLSLLAGSALVAAAMLASACARHEPDPGSPADRSAAATMTSKPPAADPAASEIDPAIIQYEQTAEIPTGLKTVRALAVGADDRIYAGGDKCIRIFDRNGKRQGEITLDAESRCLAVAAAENISSERLYLGMQQHVEVLDASGRRHATWKSPSDKADFLSIAATDQDVFVADFGNQVVWHYDSSGTLKNRIGEPDKARRIPGLAATTPYLDLVVGTSGLLYVVNPRLLRIEAYTAKGDLEATWGNGSSKLEDFFGCCNPTHLAVLPDGAFVTAEKGIPRIKIYSSEGKFQCVVAGPRQMSAVAADLAADHRGRVLALDPSSAVVRVFEKKR